MNVAHPLASIVPMLTVRVLEVVSGTTRPLTGREIHRIGGEGSAAGIWKTLNRLEEQGMLLVEHRSSGTFYEANRGHLAWPSIEALLKLRVTLFDRLIDSFAGWKIPPLHASVFGSTARGDGDTSSDVDLLVLKGDDLDTEGERVWEEQVSALRDVVRTWTGNRCQMFVIDRERLAEHIAARDPLVTSWVQDGMRLYGPPIRDFIDDLTH